MIFLSKNEGQSEHGIFNPELAGHAPESALGGSDEIVFLVLAVTVLHGVNIALSSSGRQVMDSTINVGGIGRLSQTAQRSASGA